MNRDVHSLLSLQDCHEEKGSENRLVVLEVEGQMPLPKRDLVIEPHEVSVRCQFWVGALSATVTCQYLSAVVHVIP